MGYSEEGIMRVVTAQVCEVSQNLLSVRKVVSAGNRVVFDEDGSYIENKVDGTRMWMGEKNGMYTLKMWVKRGF